MNDSEQLVRVRQLTEEDYDAVVSIQRACFPAISEWTVDEFSRHLEVFPEGQIGVEYDGTLVAASTATRVVGDAFDEEHTFDDASGDGRLDNFDPDGDTLYGLDIVVDPGHRGQRFARRIYEARKRLAAKLNLRRIVIAGRLPGLAASKLGAGEYLRSVLAKERVDDVVSAQLANGFVIRQLLRGYLPEDTESLGHAVFMEWLNPEYLPTSQTVKRARVAAAQYQMRPIDSFDDFAAQCEFFVQAASEYRVDVLLFPELVTNQLLALVEPARPAVMARSLSVYTDRYLDLFRSLAVKYYVNLVGGSHLTVEGDRLFNVSWLFRRDGTTSKQYKLHITPSEAKWWGVSPGDKLEVFDTDIGKIAILICYDSEFPELARIARSKGAEVLFVPYNTDVRSGHMRVRACSQARAIENHVYCVLSGAVGNLPLVEGSDVHYAQSCVLTPSDIPFSRDAVGAEATPNVESMVVHELDFALLRRTLRQGAVKPWLDRRSDLYAVTWREDDESFEV
jgi:predicted amidohydrolase/ribosomal protein S18 acetylase RimI-like enzyme